MQSDSRIDSTSIKGNRLVNMDCLEHCIADFMEQHARAMPDCRMPLPQWPQDSEQSHGLGIRVKTMCKSCGFTTGKVSKLYKDCFNPRKRGPKFCETNLQLVAFSFKCSIGFDDFELMCSFLGVKCMSKSNFAKLKNIVAPTIERLATNALEYNREIVSEILSHVLDGNADMQVGAMIDTVFNNPNRGRGFSSRGTQSCTTVFEGHTNRNLVIDVQPFNQLCSQCGDCDHQHCGLNLSDTVTIDSTERLAAYQSYESCLKSGMKIVDLCRDGTETSKHQAGMNQAAHELGLENPRSSACTKHLARNTANQIYKCNLSTEFFVGRPKETHNKYLSQVGYKLTKRTAWEVWGAYNASSTEDEFVEKSAAAGATVVRCLANDHSLCKENSYVCAGPSGDFPTFLPNSQYLNLTARDLLELQHKVVDYRMSENRIRMQHGMVNTNRAEAFNRHILKLVPKHKTWRRFYNTRCLSAVHTDSLGILNASLELCQAVSAPIAEGSKAIAELRRVDKRTQYARHVSQGVTRKVRRKDLGRTHFGQEPA